MFNLLKDRILQNSQASACYFIKKETLVQVFSSKICEISKNTFFTKRLLETASVILELLEINMPCQKFK